MCWWNQSLVIHKLIIPQLLVRVGLAERHCAISPLKLGLGYNCLFELNSLMGDNRLEDMFDKVIK